jgi:ATP-dependent Lon protease
VPDNVKEGLEIIPVKTVDEVLSHALTKPLVPIEWEDDILSAVSDDTAADLGGVVTH